MALIYNATFDSQTRVLSLLDKAGNVISSCEVPSKDVDDVTKPLTLRSTQRSTIALEGYHSPKGDFQTSRDGGNTWEDYALGSRITLNIGEEVSFRAKSDRKSWQDTNNYFYFRMTGKIEAWHNVMSMLRPSDFATYDIRIGFAFYHLFENCGSLTKAPILPATTFVQDPYQGMFLGCTSLTKAPELPATTLSPGCYSYMFSGCQSLTEAPELPATTLPILCYLEMFKGCQSLTKAPELPATTLASNCYTSMFEGCQSLTKAPELPATTLASNCYLSMFDGCRSLTKAPELPATKLAQNCYYHMFSGCQSLTKAPELPATTLAGNCYTGMFSGCGSLNEVRCQMPSTISAGDIPTYTGNGSDSSNVPWLNGVSSTGTFYTNADANWPSGASGIPQNWTRINEVDPNVDDLSKPLTLRSTQNGSTVTLKKRGTPVGDFQTSNDGGNTWVDYTIDTAITLNTGDEVSFRAKSDRSSAQDASNYFYFKMEGKIEAWHNVMSLYRTNDFATYKSVVDYAFTSMFYNCTSLTKAPVLPATTLSPGCYYQTFADCQSLTKAPALPATTLSNACYSNMFVGCRSLKEVRIAATTDAPNALFDWLYNVSATGDFYCDPNATIFPSNKASGIPKNWTRRNIADYPNP